MIWIPGIIIGAVVISLFLAAHYAALWLSEPEQELEQTPFTQAIIDQVKR